MGNNLSKALKEIYADYGDVIKFTDRIDNILICYDSFGYSTFNSDPYAEGLVQLIIWNL